MIFRVVNDNKLGSDNAGKSGSAQCCGDIMIMCKKHKGLVKEKKSEGHTKKDWDTR